MTTLRDTLDNEACAFLDNEASAEGLHSLLGDGAPPVESGTTEAEDKIGALMPGDDPEEHPLYEPPCRYLNVPFSELLERLEANGLPPEEEHELRRALSLQRKFHAEGITQMRR